MGGDTPPGQSPTLRSNAGVYRQCIAGCYALTQTPGQQGFARRSDQRGLNTVTMHAPESNR
jgi:hypothetical protein